ncbi:MAG: hypothetical protein RL340_1540, partial [Gemmatimonadota bacterium]
MRDAVGEGGTDPPEESGHLGGVESSRATARIDPRAPERLGGVDVAEPGEDPLVEERLLDRRASTRETRAELCTGERGIIRLRPEGEPRRPPGGVARHRAEGARVGQHQTSTIA